MFNVLEFLQQPITLRKCVYQHLNSQLTNLKPPATYELFTSTLTPTRRKSSRSRGLRKKLERFAELYSYVPDFVDSWLEYVTCLRYDCIVLDYLRVNRELESTLTQLYWIFISGHPKLGFFSPEGLLQYWCSLEEYRDSVDSDLNLLSTVVNMEHINGKELQELDGYLDRTGRKDLVHQVRFYQDEEALESAEVLDLIAMLESLKSLQAVTVTSQSLFERVVNFHGFRDHPGHTVGFAVKKRVKTLELSRCASRDLRLSMVNLSRWEAVEKVTFTFLEELDLNQVILPPHCVWLRLQSIKSLKWWNAQEIRTKLPIGSKSFGKSMDSSELYICKALLWDILHHIHRVQLIDVGKIEPAPILPLSLFNNGQVQCSGTNDASQVIFL
ncbi:Ctf13p LALA0_S02e02960g [Lachancea lanzarotensis]|uniref:LALA0S02e02960g1_1 n=1 Tax=Lachancea lanzarotensis TaxID=1245769 RepID=A0A0C7N2Z5_9SACH|nr:uncharacterized protein LALA0_S02e02960g [Lachancea lanzarotensis]CEP60932.1 LALA0S02e02960g1_1 [Lachancea lanzarotensis]